MQNRFKSKVTILSIIGLLLLAFNQFGLLDSEQMEALKKVADTVCSALVLFGVLNNPTIKNKF